MHKRVRWEGARCASAAAETLENMKKRMKMVAISLGRQRGSDDDNYKSTLGTEFRELSIPYTDTSIRGSPQRTEPDVLSTGRI